MSDPSPEMLDQLANIPSGAPASTPSAPVKPSFLGEVRKLPVTLNNVFFRLADHYKNDPKYDGLSDKQKQHFAEQRAAQDALLQTRNEFQQIKKQYNVKAFTPDMLRQSIAQDKAAFEPDSRAQLLAAQHGEDAKQIYLKEQMPKEVEGEFATLDPYARQFYDQPQKQQPASPPMRSRQAPVVQQAPAAQTDPQGSSFDGGPSPTPAGSEGTAASMPGNDARPMYAPGTENT
jgi:hypothetical protein